MDDNFSNYLNEELKKRQTAKPRYSLRAFARDLKIEPSLLSKLLRKKIPITSAMLDRLASLVGLSGADLLKYRKQIESAEGLKHFDNVEIKKVSHEEFKLIQDWYNLTIVELTTLKDFKPDASWIAQKLNISVQEASMAIERLLSLGYLKRTESGDLKKKREFEGLRLQFDSNDKALYVQAMQKRIQQFYNKSMAAVIETPTANRAHKCLTVAIDSSLITEAKKKVDNFTRSLVDDLEKRSQSKDSVYELIVSFFPLTCDE